MRWWLVLTSLALAGAAAGAPPPAPCAGCNVVVVSIDTLRADHLPCFGYGRATAPFLCELAGGPNGVLFERVSNPGGGTLPVHMSLLTSLHPEVHGMVSETADRRLEDSFVTLAERLAEADYRRVAITDGGLTKARYGFDQGFELYSDRGHGLGPARPRLGAWLDRSDRTRPFLAFLHTYEVHSERVGAERPYNPPAAYRDLFGSTPATFPGCRPGPCGTAFLTAANRQIRAGADGRTLVSPDQLQRLVDLYDGGIRAADDQLRGLVADLSARGLAERTILVVLSDHGEEFLDHGAFLHTATQYEELTHVPLVLVVPGLGGGGRRVRELASIVDVMPTLLALLGIDPGPHAQGHDLMPLVLGAGPVRAEALTTSSIHTSAWKLFPGRMELYDRIRDPTDRRNVAASHPEVVASLARRSAELVAECLRLRRQILGDEAGSPGSPPVLDKGTAAELEALGYLER